MKSFLFGVATLFISTFSLATVIPDAKDDIWSTRMAQQFPSAFVSQDVEVTSIIKGNIDTRTEYTWWLVQMQPIFLRPFPINEIRVDGKTIVNCQQLGKGTCSGIVSSSTNQFPKIMVAKVGLTEQQVQQIKKGKVLEIVEVALDDPQHKVILVKPLTNVSKALDDVVSGNIQQHKQRPSSPATKDEDTTI